MIPPKERILEFGLDEKTTAAYTSWGVAQLGGAFIGFGVALLVAVRRSIDILGRSADPSFFSGMNPFGLLMITIGLVLGVTGLLEVNYALKTDTAKPMAQSEKP